MLSVASFGGVTFFFLKVVQMKITDKINKLIDIISKEDKYITKQEIIAAKAVERINTVLAEKTKYARSNRLLVAAALEKMIKEHEDLLGKKRSRKFNNALIGFKQSTCIQINKDTVKLIEKIFKNKSSQYLHIIKNPDKNALRKLSDQQLNKIHANKIVSDRFFIKF